MIFTFCIHRPIYQGTYYLHLFSDLFYKMERNSMKLTHKQNKSRKSLFTEIPSRSRTEFQNLKNLMSNSTSDKHP